MFVHQENRNSNYNHTSFIKIAGCEDEEFENYLYYAGNIVPSGIGGMFLNDGETKTAAIYASSKQIEENIKFFKLEEWKEKYKEFALVRDPIERFISIISISSHSSSYEECLKLGTPDGDVVDLIDEISLWETKESFNQYMYENEYTYGPGTLDIKFKGLINHPLNLFTPQSLLVGENTKLYNIGNGYNKLFEFLVDDVGIYLQHIDRKPYLDEIVPTSEIDSFALVDVSDNLKEILTEFYKEDYDLFERCYNL